MQELNKQRNKGMWRIWSSTACQVLGVFSHAISHLAFTPNLSGRFLIFSSVQFSHSFMSDCLQPHESQHARPPCPSPTPGVYSNSCASSRWYHPTISSSVVPFSCPQSILASGSFPMRKGSLHQVAKVLELQLQHESFQWVFRVDFL